MPTKRTCTNSLFFLSLLILISFSSPTPSQESSACKSTPHPKLCRWILSVYNSSSSSSPYKYTKFSIKQSLKHAKHLSKLINHYITRHVADGALSDCGVLFDLNVDYLHGIMSELESADESGTSSTELEDRVVTLLSGVMTNQQTCYDGIRESGGWDNEVVRSLHAPVVNGTELYSVSLGLITHALDRVKENKRQASLTGRVWKTSVKILEALKDEVQNKTKFHGESIGGRRGLMGRMISNGVLIRELVTVSLQGDGNFTSINKAIALAPNNSKLEDGYFVIHIKQGHYQEYVTIGKHKKGIMMIGDGINQTVISGNRSVFDGWTTFKSATFAVSGERFVGIGITFMNIAGPWKHQAVAVRNNADLSTFYKCSFMGYQDTLYVHSMRQFYRECDIYGTVDFIFGNSASVFQTCNIYPRKPLSNQKNALTAQGRSDPNQNTGISIHNCTIKAAPELAEELESPTLTYLGRPWHNFSRTVYMQSYIGEVIDPVGWLAWNETVGVDTIFYGEFENYGPGANTSQRVKWSGHKMLSIDEALNFTVTNLTMGDTWLPYADIPYASGLL